MPVVIESEEERKAALEDRDEYIAANIFWVPQEARWPHLRANAKQPTIGKTLDDAMVAIERDNPSLKNVLPKDYARPALDKQRLGELIDLIGTIGLGDKTNRSKDILGRVYGYFLGQFASAEGKKGGQFYTAHCVVQLLVEMLAHEGRSGRQVPTQAAHVECSVIRAVDVAAVRTDPEVCRSGWRAHRVPLR
jgi:type I restriction enzyme M protein